MQRERRDPAMFSPPSRGLCPVSTHPEEHRRIRLRRLIELICLAVYLRTCSAMQSLVQPPPNAAAPLKLPRLLRIKSRQMDFWLRRAGVDECARSIGWQGAAEKRGHDAGVEQGLRAGGTRAEGKSCRVFSPGIKSRQMDFWLGRAGADECASSIGWQGAAEKRGHDAGVEQGLRAGGTRDP